MERRTDLWVTPDHIIDAYQTVIPDGFIAHLQGLAETHIGTHPEPTLRLQSVFTEIVYRKWSNRDTSTDLAYATLGPYTEGYRPTAGQGLTDRDIKQLHQAVGTGGVWVLPTTRGPVEIPGPPKESL